MSAAPHTFGKVVHDQSGHPRADIRAEAGRAIAVTWLVGARQPKSKEAYTRRVAEDRANARRIAACWNYCIGLTTDEMEASVARGDAWDDEDAAMGAEISGRTS